VITPRHVAIIMDGNGRWATRRGLPRQAGHVRGADAVRRAVEFAARRGIGVLTLYAFSADNWRRPGGEIRGLLALFEEYLRSQAAACLDGGIRLSIVGRRDRLPPSLRRAMARAEADTQGGAALHLRLAIDYSSREALWLAADALVRRGGGTRADFSARLRSGSGDEDARAHEAGSVPDVDLVIRTGGERRLSDFLLWESAYAELCFLDVAWPDFSHEDFDRALADYAGRDRRFGALSRRHEAAAAERAPERQPALVPRRVVR
jgi:undecaprenyl diphosphate synthase